MEKKPIPIKMNPTVHTRIKYRAKRLGLPIGDMIENLLSGYETRIKRAFKGFEKFKTPDAEDKVLLLLLQADMVGYKDYRIEEGVKKILDEAFKETYPVRCYISRFNFPDDTDKEK